MLGTDEYGLKPERAEPWVAVASICQCRRCAALHRHEGSAFFPIAHLQGQLTRVHDEGTSVEVIGSDNADAADVAQSTQTRTTVGHDSYMKSG